jgi:hypothetical protein
MGTIASASTMHTVHVLQNTRRMPILANTIHTLLSCSLREKSSVRDYHMKEIAASKIEREKFLSSTCNYLIILGNLFCRL